MAPPIPSSLKPFLAVQFNRIKRTLTTYTQHQFSSRPNQPEPIPQYMDPPNPEVMLDKKKLLSSFLSNHQFNSYASRDLLMSLNPIEFDSIFCDIYKNVNCATAFNFFNFARQSFGFRFTLKSYSILFHLLVCKNSRHSEASARVLLASLIDGKFPMTLRKGVDDVYREIAGVVLDTLRRDKSHDETKGRYILLHVYATQFPSFGLNIVFDLFENVADQLSLPFKTWPFLMRSLVKMNEEEMAYDVFRIIQRVCVPNLSMFQIALSALLRLGKVVKALDLFKELENSCVDYDTYTYNILVDGVCKHRNMDEACLFKDRMVADGFKPSSVTFGVIINGLMKLERFDEANGILNEMLEKGIVPSAKKTGPIVYTTLIDGYCKIRDMKTALKLKDEMVSKGISPTRPTYCSLVHGLSELGRVDELRNLSHEMRQAGFVANTDCLNALISGYCKLGNTDEANLLMEGICSRHYNKDAYATTPEMTAFYGVLPNTKTYAILIGSYCNIGKMTKAFELLSFMKEKTFSPDINCYNALIGGHCQLGKMDETKGILLEMASRNILPNKETYTCLINGYCKLGRAAKAYEYICDMLSNGMYSSRKNK